MVSDVPYFRFFTGGVIHGLLLAIIKYMASSLLPGLLLECTNATVHALKIVSSNTANTVMSLMGYKLIAIFVSKLNFVKY